MASGVHPVHERSGGGQTMSTKSTMSTLPRGSQPVAMVFYEICGIQAISRTVDLIDFCVVP